MKETVGSMSNPIQIKTDINKDEFEELTWIKLDAIDCDVEDIKIILYKNDFVSIMLKDVKIKEMHATDYNETLRVFHRIAELTLINYLNEYK